MKITIKTELDLTPEGARSVRMVNTSQGGKQIRWYVGGRIFRKLAANAQNADLSQNWLRSKYGHKFGSQIKR